MRKWESLLINKMNGLISSSYPILIETRRVENEWVDTSVENPRTLPWSMAASGEAHSKVLKILAYVRMILRERMLAKTSSVDGIVKPGEAGLTACHA